MRHVERFEIELASGQVLHMLWNGEGKAYGYVTLEADGTARTWEPTWVDEYTPTGEVYPDIYSAIRAVLIDAGVNQ